MIYVFVYVVNLVIYDSGYVTLWHRLPFVAPLRSINRLHLSLCRRYGKGRAVVILRLIQMWAMVHQNNRTISCHQRIFMNLRTLNQAPAPLTEIVEGARDFPLGPYRRPMPRVLCWSKGGVLFLMSEVPL